MDFILLDLKYRGWIWAPKIIQLCPRQLHVLRANCKYKKRVFRAKAGFTALAATAAA